MFFSRWRRRSGSYSLYALTLRGSRVADPALFERMLVRERLRVDRSGIGFSVLVISAREPHEAIPTFDWVLGALARRVRDIDEIGWIDHNRLAVLLPYTHADGAWCLADDLFQHFPDAYSPPHCEVLAYPDEESPASFGKLQRQDEAINHESTPHLNGSRRNGDHKPALTGGHSSNGSGSNGSGSNGTPAKNVFSNDSSNGHSNGHAPDDYLSEEVAGDLSPSSRANDELQNDHVEHLNGASHQGHQNGNGHATIATRLADPLGAIIGSAIASTTIEEPKRVDAPAPRKSLIPKRIAKPLAPLLAKDPPRSKRLVEMIGSATLLVLLAPLMALIAIGVKVFSPGGPVLFKQLRRGRGGRIFAMYKFRTMIANAESLKDSLRSQSEQDGPAFKMRNDPRITWFGRLLRKSSLDELPQIWNALRGDMSLVGPRPLPVSEADGCLDWQKRRLDVTPGLTCTWQVSARSKVSFEEWMRMDIRYVEKHSLWTDLSLIARTIPAIFRASGS